MEFQALGNVAREVSGANELWLALVLTHPAPQTLSPPQLAGALGVPTWLPAGWEWGCVRLHTCTLRVGTCCSLVDSSAGSAWTDGPQPYTGVLAGCSELSHPWLPALLSPYQAC